MFIVLGVTGGIAAYKSVALARLLVEEGHEVHVVPSEDALRFVGRPTWEAISRNPVTTSVHENVPEVRHVALGQRADLVIVAPATANTLARMAAGLADDLLGTTLLAASAPVLVAPAMHTEMWLHPATRHNVAVLEERGVHVIGPDSGRLTGADTGPGRMSEPEDIAVEARRLLPRSGSAGSAAAAGRDAFDLLGERVLVTAGGTREPIDPVRFIGNRSSGRQGVALAIAAADRGAEVTLIACNIDGAVLAEARSRPRIEVRTAGSTAELESAAVPAAREANIVVMAAAVSDYRVADIAEQKLRKEDAPGEAPTIRLVENPDILAGITASRKPGQIFVGFAAETASSSEELVERGLRKRRRKGVDLLAVNAVGWSEGFEREENTLHFVGAGDRVLGSASGTKRDVSDALLDTVLRLRTET